MDKEINNNNTEQAKYTSPLSGEGQGGEASAAKHTSPLYGEGQGGEASAAKHTSPPSGGGHGGEASFSMPMFNDWVPEKIRPWIYIFIAFTFQLSGARYLGAMADLIGQQSLMREDLLMCLYSNMMGMAIWFPMLFRMKFRFTNHTLLIGASITVIITNLLTMHVTFLPLLWAICFIEGMAKMQGTFECMSNIQLWMTSKRDFTIFFPLLHIFLTTGITGGMFLGAVFAYYFDDWRTMHWFIICLQCVTLIILFGLTHHFRFMKMPLKGIDWTSLLLFSAFILQVSFILDYGDFYQWFNHDTIWYLTGTSLITLAIFLRRITTIRHPYFNPKLFTRFRFVKRILLMVCIVAMITASESVIEEAFLAEGLHYSVLTCGMLQIPVWIGNITGCVFSLWFLQKVVNKSYVKLGIVAALTLCGYHVIMYFIISPAINIEMLYAPLFLRGFSFTCFGVFFLGSMQRVTDFNHLFQGYGCVNTVRMFFGGVIGGAIFTKGLHYYVAEGMARYGQNIDLVHFSQNGYRVVTSWLPHGLSYGQFMPEYAEQMVMYAVKNLYGWASIASIVLIFAFLIFDSPLRRNNDLMQPWHVVGDMLQKHLNHSVPRDEDPFAIPAAQEDK